MTEATLDDTLQIACQLTHLTGSEEHVGCAVVIEEQGGIVKMAQTGMDSPRTFGLRSREDIGIAHRTLLIRSQECPELTIVVFQRGGPLSTTIDRTLLQIILRRIRQFVEDIAHRLPVHQILRGHDGRTWHEVHRSCHQIEGVSHTNHVRIGHICPQHGIVDLYAVTLSR